MFPKTWIGYKQVFSHLYPASALDSHHLRDMVAFLPDGQLAIQLGDQAETIDLTVSGPIPSTLLLSGGQSYQDIETPDGRYRLQIDLSPQNDVTEFWLIHTDRASGKFKRVKLNTEWQNHTGRAHPRIAVSPKGTFFLADDSGIVRLYSAAYLLNIGTFLVAHPHTENQIIGLAVSAGEQFIAALNTWGDVFLYNIVQGRVVFVRNIQDGIGWYDPRDGYVLVTDDAQVIVTAGISSADYSPQHEARLSITVFRTT